jgi:hypothetical protein
VLSTSGRRAALLRARRLHRAVDSALQGLADRAFWTKLAGGYHLARDTAAAIRVAGFQIECEERIPFKPNSLLPAISHNPRRGAPVITLVPAHWQRAG